MRVVSSDGGMRALLVYNPQQYLGIHFCRFQSQYRNHLMNIYMQYHSVGVKQYLSYQVFVLGCCLSRNFYKSFWPGLSREMVIDMTQVVIFKFLTIQKMSLR